MLNEIFINKKNILCVPNSISLILDIPPCNVKNPFDSKYVRLKVTEIRYPSVTFSLYQTKDNYDLIDLWEKSAGELLVELPISNFTFKKGLICGHIEYEFPNNNAIIHMTGERETTYSTWAEGCVFIP